MPAGGSKAFCEDQRAPSGNIWREPVVLAAPNVIAPAICPYRVGETADHSGLDLTRVNFGVRFNTA